KTSVRGNYRIAFDRINSFSFSSSVFQGMPGLTYQVTDSTSGQDTVTGSTFVSAGVRAAGWKAPALPPGATPQSLATPPAYSNNSLTVSDPHMQTPTVGMWGLSVQRELVHNLVLTASYIGNHGTHLYGGYDSNQVNYSANGFLDSFIAAQQGVSTPLMQQIVNADTRHTTGQTAVQFLQKNYAANLTHNDVAGVANSFANRLQNATTANPYGVPLVVTAGLSDLLQAISAVPWRNVCAANARLLQLQRAAASTRKAFLAGLPGDGKLYLLPRYGCQVLRSHIYSCRYRKLSVGGGNYL